MHPRIQQRRDVLLSQRTRLAIQAIEDLAKVLEVAGAEVERHTGLFPSELAAMANAYRYVVHQLKMSELTESDLVVVCNRIASSAEAALLLVRTIAEQPSKPAGQPATLH